MFFNSKILAAIMAFSATLSVCGGKIDIAVWNNCGRNRPGATVSFTVNIPANEALEKAKGHYGQWDAAVKYIDPRHE